MEFWGVEVKAGEALKVKPEDAKIIHISQAALGDGKRDKVKGLIPLRIKINGEKFIVGSLSAENFPQIIFDLVFEKEFELSHDWENGSVYFCGYSADNPFADDEDDEFDSEDEEEDALIGINENGKIESIVEQVKPDANKGKVAKPESSAKQKVTVVEPKKDGEPDEDDDESDEDQDDDESDDEDMMNIASDVSGDLEDEDDSDDLVDSEDEEETPKKAEPGKKRPTESSKTPVAAKKVKLDTPQKTDGKKGGGHTATPHPSKKVGKTSANGNKSKEETPKSDGKVSCNSCPRTFNSGKALESHSKAKHGDK